MNQRNIKSGPASQASAPVTVINAPQVQIRKRLLSNSRRTIQSTNVMLLTKHLLNNTEVRQKNRASALNEGNITKNDLSLSLTKNEFRMKMECFLFESRKQINSYFSFHSTLCICPASTASPACLISTGSKTFYFIESICTDFICIYSSFPSILSVLFMAAHKQRQTIQGKNSSLLLLLLFFSLLFQN